MSVIKRTCTFEYRHFQVPQEFGKQIVACVYSDRLINARCE